MRLARTSAVWTLAILAAIVSSGSWTAASSVDGAGRIVVIPIVVSGQTRESIITMTNAGPEPLRITSKYIGADGFPLAGDKTTCKDQQLAGSGSLTVALKDLCDMAPDAENLGYLEMTSHDADTRFTFFATSVLSSNGGNDTSTIAGHPIGSHTPAWPYWTRSVLGLRTQGPGARHPESLSCFVATFDESTSVDVTLVDGSGSGLKSASLTRPSRSMVRLVLGDAQRPTTDLDNVSVLFLSRDFGTSAVGCALEDFQTKSIAYQPAQTATPADRSRLKDVQVEWNRLYEGPYQIGGLVWEHTSLWGSFNYKVVLSTYLRPNDSVRCFLTAPSFPGSGPADPTPWLELQVRAPDGTVVAGGSGVRDTGVFHTGPAGRFHPTFGQRWFIDISFDEATSGWPKNWGNWGRAYTPGTWAVHCQSATGMSQPLGVPVPLGNTDNF